jgi:hypothetical protein
MRFRRTAGQSAPSKQSKIILKAVNVNQMR